MPVAKAADEQKSTPTRHNAARGRVVLEAVTTNGFLFFITVIPLSANSESET